MSSSFGVDFGQKVDLTASIRNILRNYPEGTAILKELIQNADDANATSVTFILDHRSHGINTVADPALVGFQGPSLLVYNNAIFTEEDFNSIQRIGDSLKKTENSQAKIGRFGIGFNAVYHWTDLPSFISSKYLVMLDPQARFLPNVNPSNPGKMIDFITYPDIIAQYPDQFKPYEIDPMHSWKTPYHGTMFRLPLRTIDQAKSSLLSKRSLTNIEAGELLLSLQIEASRMLLFLKNINKIEIKEIKDDMGKSELKLLYSSEIHNFSNTMLNHRCIMSKYPSHLLQIQSNIDYNVSADYTMIIKCINQNHSKRNLNHSIHQSQPLNESWELWEVCNQLGGKNINRIAVDPDNNLLRLVPWAGVATCICISTKNITESKYHNNELTDLIEINPLYTEGLAYCFLPLPVYTGLPVMVNGFFELSSNRRDVWQAGADMTGDGKTRAVWNVSLMRDIIAPCYCRLLHRIRDLLDFSIQYQQLWPSWNVKQPWKEIAKSMLLLAKDQKLMKKTLNNEDNDALTTISPNKSFKSKFKSVLLNKGLKSIDTTSNNNAWIKCSEAVITPKREGFISLSDADESELTSYLIAVEEISFVQCDERLKITLIDSQACMTIANPNYVRKILKQCVLKVKDQNIVSFRGIPDARLCKFLLKYCTSDIPLGSSNMKDLDLLPILPILNQSVSSLRIYSKEQVQSIESLTAMGYSLTQSLFALSHTQFDMNNACEYLSSNTEYHTIRNQNNNILVSGYNKSDSILFLLEGTDYDIFQEASYILLNKNHIAPNEIDYLINKHIQKQSNVRTFAPQYIPDLLRYILPNVCFELNKVICSDLSLESCEKLLIFLKAFWQYAATRNDVLRSVVLGACIVPTLGLKFLYPLSKMSNFMVQRKGDVFLPVVISDILIILGVNIVDPLLASSDSEVMMPSVFWEYIYSPSRHGILMTLEFIIRNSLTSFDLLSTSQRKDLRLYLATCEPIKNISIQEIEIIRNLPIFQVYRFISDNTESNINYVNIISRNFEVNTNNKVTKQGYTNKNTYLDDTGLAYVTLASFNHIPDKLLPSYVLKYESIQDYQLLQHLHIQVLSQLDFYRLILLPNVSYLYKQHPEDIMDVLFHILDNINQLIHEDRDFLNYLQAIAFIPASDKTIEVLNKPSDLFDPSCPELSLLLGPEMFPTEMFQRSDYLIILRSLGLKKSLDWKGILQCATSIASSEDYILNTSTTVVLENNGSDQSIYVPNMKKISRSTSLLRFLDKNIDQIIHDFENKSKVKENHSFNAFPLFHLSSVFSSSSKSSKNQQINDAKEKDLNISQPNIQSYLEELRTIAWVPVVYERLSPSLPWPYTNNNNNTSTEKGLSLCAAPSNTALVKDAWLCSMTKRLVAQTISSPSLVHLMLWDIQLPVSVITLQLSHLAQKYLNLRKEEENHVNAKEIQMLREKLTELIPQFYHRFNNIASGNIFSNNNNNYNNNNNSSNSTSEINIKYLQLQREDLRKALENIPWIWVGDAFVTIDQVALSTTFNAAPYLYQLPPDLQVYTHLLSLFQIKSRFTPRDYIESLRQMALECKCKSELKSNMNTQNTDKPLSETRLDIAISLATLLSTEASINNLNGQNIYLPDNIGRLALAETLINDDVPWLSGPEYISVRSGCRLIHPNISSLVAEKLGVKSLRLSLLSKNLEQNLFSSFEGEIESFGQAESLTNRLKTILDMYPDGSPIFSELIQNADDAGATIIRILLDEHSYSCESLLDGKMSELQGPSLIVYNDAAFTEADFKCLAKIGQGSKLEKLATTGRFGLGFNSTYHLTDTPSVVSGDYLVIFDPHCNSVPGATVNQPGVRIRFTGSNLSSTFKDQFLPFQYFGCDVLHNFPGTIFRFPLRTITQARKSEISKRSYSITDVEANLKQLISQLSNMLIFLRNVRCIEIYRNNSSLNQEPILLHRSKSSITKVENINEQSLLTYFDKAINNKSSAAELSRDGFYKRLLSTSDENLPKTFSKVRIVTDLFVNILKESNKLILSENQSELIVNNQIVEYLVITGLCGGTAKRMACQESLRHFKLIPMGAIAACTYYQSEENNHNVSMYPPTNGQAFCFLPLPTVQTHIPVHLNAYWELSSNRRDIWRGDDTTGEAKVRSDWNIHIMKDVLAPLYSVLLCRIHKEIILENTLTDSSSNTTIVTNIDNVKINQHLKFLSLLPSPLPQKPWDYVAYALFEALKSHKLLWSKLNQGSYVAMKDAYILEKNQNSLDKDESMKEQLEELLLMEQVPVVITPTNVFKALLSCNSVAGEVNPALLRSIFHISNDRPHKSLQDLPVDNKNIQNNKEITKSSIILNAVTIKRAVFLLQYCLNDITANSNGYSKLIGVCLLPLENNTLGTFSGCTDAIPYFMVSETERKLLQAAGSSIVASDAVLGQVVSTVLRDEQFSQACNVRMINVIDVLKLICTFIIPNKWLVANNSIVDMTGVISSDWLISLWNYIFEANCIEMFHEVIPLLPIVCPNLNSNNNGTYLTKISTQIPVLHMSYKDIDINAVKALSDLGIYIFEPTILGSKSYTSDMTKLLTPPSARSVLDAIVSRVSTLVPLDTTNKTINRFLDSIISPISSVRLALQEFILDAVLSKLSDELNPKDVLALCFLPIWNISSTTFDVLDLSVIQLPPKDIDHCLLNNNYIHMRSEKDRSLYLKLGILESSMGSFLVTNVIPQLVNSNLQQFNHYISIISYERLETLSFTILKNLSQLEKEYPGITTMLSNCPLFFCNENLCGNNSSHQKLYKALDLYNPEIALFRSFIPSSYFPASKLCNDSALLKGLIKLGIKHTVSASDIIEIALSIQSELDRNVVPITTITTDINDIQQNISNNSINKEQMIVNRGKGLLEYLELHIEEILQECAPESFIEYKKETIPNDLGGNWASELRAIKWIPVHVRLPPPSHVLLIYSENTVPWPSKTHSIALATPSQCNTLEKIWLCSSTYRICMVEVKSKLLLTVLGWNKPISGRCLASQLLGIKSLYDQGMIEGKSEPHTEIFDKMFPVIYSNLNSAYQRESSVEIDLWKNALLNKPIFWIKKQFVEPFRLAFKPILSLSSNANTEPFLFVLTSELYIQHKLLLIALGAREQFEAIDLANLTRDLYLANKDVPLSATVFTLCLGIIDLISNLIRGNLSTANDISENNYTTNSKVLLSELGVIYLPDHKKIFQPASMLTYDDAPWLSDLLAVEESSNNIQFVHSKVDITTAREVGCKSLREQLFTGEEIMCPDSERLHGLLDDDSVKDTLNDLLHVADNLNAPVLQILFDEQTYGTQSLLYPGLADTQGPALIAYMEGPIVTYEQLIKLLNFHAQNFIDDIHPSNKYDVITNNNHTNPLTLDTRKKYLPSSGKKLASAFAITDCLQILTGNEFYLFDPCGCYLLRKHTSSIVSNSDSIESDRSDKNHKNILKSKLKRTSSSSVSKLSTGIALAQHYILTNKIKGSTKVSQNNNKFNDALHQFPDQFSSFLSLKHLQCYESLHKNGFVHGILIRMPLRTTKSTISSQITSMNDIKLAFGSFTGTISGSLLFANTLSEVTLFHNATNTNTKNKSKDINDVNSKINIIPEIKMKLLNLPGLRNSRYNITEDKGWDKHGFSKFFSKAYTPTEVLYSLMIELQIHCTEESIWIKPNSQLQSLIDQNSNVIIKNNMKTFHEEWLIASINGYGRIKDLALMEPYVSLALQPFTSIAMQVLSEEQLKQYDIDPSTGITYRCSSPISNTYLPFHIEGNFIESKIAIDTMPKSKSTTTITTNNQNQSTNNNNNSLLNIFDSNNNTSQVRVQNWNDSLLLISIDHLYPKLLFELKRKIEVLASKKITMEEKNKILSGFYKYFIYSPRLSGQAQKLLSSANMYWTCIIQNPLYLLHTKISFQYLHEVILPSKQFHSEVNSYLVSILPIANCPHQLSKDISDMVRNNKVNTLTPKRVRTALSNNIKDHGIYLSNNLHIMKDLLKYVLSDMIDLESEGEYNKRKKYRELCGCMLMPMADMSIKPYPQNASEQVAIAPLILHELLPTLKSSFLHPTLLNEFLLFKETILLDSLFISSFSIGFIDHNISHIIPSFWKLAPAICWMKSDSFTFPAGYFTRFLHRTITSIPTTIPFNENDGLSSPSPLLIYVLWNNYLSKETDINSLNKLKDYPLVPIISKNRRLLFSVSLLPHIFSMTSNNQQDHARSNLKREIGRMATLCKNEVDEADKRITTLVTSMEAEKLNRDWLWTTKRIGDYDIIDENTESKTEEVSNNNNNNVIPVAQALELTNTINAEEVTAVESTTDTTTADDVIPVALTVLADDAITMGLQAVSISASSDVIAAMIALGVPFFDNSIFESTPLFVSQPYSGVNSSATNMQGRRVLQCLHRLDQCNILVQTSSSTEIVTNESSESLLMYDQLSIANRNKLLLHIFQDHTILQPFSVNEISQLKELRLFTNQITKAAVSYAECEHGGVYWCLDESVLDNINISSSITSSNSSSDSVVVPDRMNAMATASQSNMPTTATKNAVILYFEPGLRDLYTFLGIEELTASTAVRKFTIPLLAKMDAFTRIEVMLGLAKNWNMYRTDQALVQQLKELPFIPLWDCASASSSSTSTNNSNTTTNTTSIDMNEIKIDNMNYLNNTKDLRKASDLIIWTNQDLLEALSGKDAPTYFPPPYLRSSELHLMCCDLGMKLDLNEDMLKHIVLNIENDANIAMESPSHQELLHTTSDRGRRILRYIRQEDRISILLQNASYARIIGKIRFVPMNFPESVSYGGFVSYRKDIGRFDQLVSKAQGSLAFTIMPVIEDDIAPPQYYYSFLGVTGTPKVEVILRHIRNLTNMGETLDRWNAPSYNIIQTFNSIFQYLTDQWKNISPQIKSTLSDTYLVPVGHLLIKPSRLFFKLTEDLSPFMHEVPRHFGGHEGFLKSIGIREVPIVTDYLHFLSDLALECGLNTLNPNELRAVLAIIQVIALQLNETSDQSIDYHNIGLDNIYLPDENAYMRHISTCLYNDNDWLASKINQSLKSSGLFFIHSSVSIDIVKLLDIYQLTSVIIESAEISDKELIEDFEIKQKENEYQLLFNNELFIDSLSLLLFQSHINNNNHNKHISNSISSENMSSNIHTMKSFIIKSLQELKLCFVTKLKTNYHLLHPITNKKVLLPENALDIEKHRPYFLHKTTQSSTSYDVLYINYQAIKPPLNIEMMISSGLCQRFNVDMSLSFAIGTLLQVKSMDDMNTILNSLHINNKSTNTILQQSRQRGMPGEVVIEADRNLLELKPLRVFRIGEIVAYQMKTKEINSDVTSPNDLEKIIYAKIISVGAVADSGIRRLNIKLGPTEVLSILSTEVFSFKSARELQDHKQKQKVTSTSNDNNNGSIYSIMKNTILSKNNNSNNDQYVSITNNQSSSSSIISINKEDSNILPNDTEVIAQEEVLSAVNSLLTRAGLTFDLNQQNMVSHIMNLEESKKRIEKELNFERQQLVRSKELIEQAESDMKCPICCNESVTFVLTPCGHTLCEQCANLMRSNRCPHCRANIQNKVKFFLPGHSSVTTSSK